MGRKFGTSGTSSQHSHAPARVAVGPITIAKMPATPPDEAPSTWAVDTGLAAGSVATLAVLATMADGVKDKTFHLGMAIIATAGVLALIAAALHAAGWLWKGWASFGKQMDKALPTTTSRLVVTSFVPATLIAAALSPSLGDEGLWLGALSLLACVGAIFLAWASGRAQMIAKGFRTLAFALLLTGVGVVLTLQGKQSAEDLLNEGEGGTGGQTEDLPQPSRPVVIIVGGGRTDGPPPEPTPIDPPRPTPELGPPCVYVVEEESRCAPVCLNDKSFSSRDCLACVQTDASSVCIPS